MLASILLLRHQARSDFLIASWAPTALKRDSETMENSDDDNDNDDVSNSAIGVKMILQWQKIQQRTIFILRAPKSVQFH